MIGTNLDSQTSETTSVPVITPTWAGVTQRFLDDAALHGMEYLYHAGLETRIMAIPDEELPDELQGNQAWNVSFPSTSNQANEPTDAARIWHLRTFCSRVGVSGWNYVQQVAEHITFEFDHSDGHDNALTTEQLGQIARKLGGYCEVRRSTHGKGLHCRIKLAEPVPVRDRAEYAALCRYSVGELGKQFDTNLLDMTCGVGCILWIWSKTTTSENGGFELLYPQAEEFVVDEGWREQIPARSVRTCDGQTVELDQEHQRLVDWLEEHGHPNFVHHFGGGECIGTHSCALLAAYKALNLRGTYSTISSGSNPSEPNCYMVPRTGGAWQVFRFGTADEPSWNKRKGDGRSWCWLNQFDAENNHDWNDLCVQHGGTRKNADRKKTYVLSSIESAVDAIAHAGGCLSFPDIPDREITLTLDDGTIYCEMEKFGEEPTPEGWSKLSANRFGCSCTVTVVEVDRNDYSALQGIRIGYYMSESIRQESGTEFFVQHDDGTWKCESKDNVRLLLRSRGLSAGEIDELIGGQIQNPMKITAIPFEDEHPEPGIWNRGYKFTCEPKKGNYPHYQMILEHVGKGLDEAVSNDAWCKEHGISSGGHFLFVYFAIMVQKPDRRTPYLFLQSAENASGKSTLTDAIGLLLEDGAVVAADHALTNQQGFNRELVGGIIFAINETNLGRAGEAYSRMKEYVTNQEISIHPKGGTPFKSKNWSRCIQTANDLSHCPVGFDDERVIVIQVEKIAKEKVLDWASKLEPALIAERGCFLHALLNYELPPVAPGSRCFLPILKTDAKQVSIENNLPNLSDDQEEWFQQVLELVQQGKWNGLLTFEEIKLLLTAPPGNSNTWRSAWMKMDLHFRNNGLSPDSRGFVKNGLDKGPAAWGFQN